jgi:secondary thiamine-phosphate synthase enzyme
LEVPALIERIRVASRDKQDLVDITREVNGALSAMNVRGGICQVFIPHTTAGVIVNENADPAVGADMLDMLEELVPQARRFRHAEGNSPAHIKSSIVGHSVTLPVESGRLALGTWQGVFLAEFDGPRNRTIVISVVEA